MLSYSFNKFLKSLISFRPFKKYSYSVGGYFLFWIVDEFLQWKRLENLNKRFCNIALSFTYKGIYHSKRGIKKMLNLKISSRSLNKEELEIRLFEISQQKKSKVEIAFDIETALNMVFEVLLQCISLLAKDFKSATLKYGTCWTPLEEHIDDFIGNAHLEVKELLKQENSSRAITLNEKFNLVEQVYGLNMEQRKEISKLQDRIRNLFN